MFVKHEFKKQSCTNAKYSQNGNFCLFLCFGRIFPSNRNALLEFQKATKNIRGKIDNFLYPKISHTQLEVVLD